MVNIDITTHKTTKKKKRKMRVGQTSIKKVLIVIIQKDFHKIKEMEEKEGVSNGQKIAEQKLNLFLEKNVPTNPSKWSYYKSQAKRSLMFIHQLIKKCLILKTIQMVVVGKN